MCHMWTAENNSILQILISCFLVVLPDDCFHFRHVRKLESRSPGSVTMSASQWQEIVVCVWWRLRRLQR